MKAGFVAEPPQLTQSVGSATVSTVIGLQPAVAVDLPPPFAPARIPLPPLKDSTEYAVIVTDGVKDFPTGQPLQTSTLQKILLFSNPLVDASGKSLVGGVDNATASGLEKIRQAVGAAVAKAQADGKIADKSHVVAAYTFKTQAITGRSAFANPPGPSAGVQIAAIPYTALLPGVCAALAQALGLPANTDCTKPLPGSTKVYTAAGAAGSALTDAFDKYGVDRAVFGGASTHIDAIIETKIVTVNKLDDATGAFKSDPAAAVPEVINVLLAVPAAGAANTAQCSGPLAGLAPATCLPVAIWHHGLGGSRASVLTVVETFTGAGLAIAATDAPKHGDRSFCSALNSLNLTGGRTKDAECIPGNFCVPDPTLAGGSTDPVADPANGIPVSGAPGKCHTADSLTAPLGLFQNKPVLCIGSGPSDCSHFSLTNPGGAGTPAASGEYFISGNFFRTRDTIRQDTIDFAQLVQVLEPSPAANIPGHDVYNALIARGLVLIPDASTGTSTGHTYWVGQSLGGILGTINTAVNPRISRAALNVPGGTLVDTFTNSPAFQKQVDALFLSLGVDRTQLSDPAVAAKYLQIISLAKWILDPADPIDYAGHITTDPLPNHEAAA